MSTDSKKELTQTFQQFHLIFKLLAKPVSLASLTLVLEGLHLQFYIFGFKAICQRNTTPRMRDSSSSVFTIPNTKSISQILDRDG